MRTDCITFRSVTPAQRAQKLLRQAGIDTILQRTPRWMEERGCGYCLRLHSGEVVAAVTILRDKQVAFSKVYTTVDGKTEEWVR